MHQVVSHRPYLPLMQYEPAYVIWIIDTALQRSAKPSIPVPRVSHVPAQFPRAVSNLFSRFRSHSTDHAEVSWANETRFVAASAVLKGVSFVDRSNGEETASLSLLPLLPALVLFLERPKEQHDSIDEAGAVSMRDSQKGHWPTGALLAVAGAAWTVAA